MALELKKKRGEFTNLQLARRLQAYGIGHTSQIKFSILTPRKETLILFLTKTNDQRFLVWRLCSVFEVKISSPPSSFAS